MHAILSLVLAAVPASAQLDPDAGPPSAAPAAQVTMPAETITPGKAAPAWPAADDEMPKTALDMIYYGYGTACLGMDWRFLKAMAEIESGQDPRSHTGKYVGLFQVEPGEDRGDTCPTYIKPFAGVLGGCADLEDPEVNTAVAAHRFHRHFQAEWLTAAGAFKPDAKYRGIEKVCSGASVADKVAISYIGHNNGPAVLQHVLKKASADPSVCADRDKVRAAVRSFYEDNAGSRDDGMFLKDGKLVDCKDKEKLVGIKTFRCVSGDYGVAKYDYGLKKADKLKHLKSLYPAGALNPEECPIRSKRLYPCGKERLTKERLLGSGSVCPG